MQAETTAASTSVTRSLSVNNEAWQQLRGGCAVVHNANTHTTYTSPNSNTTWQSLFYFCAARLRLLKAGNLTPELVLVALRSKIENKNTFETRQHRLSLVSFMSSALPRIPISVAASKSVSPSSSFWSVWNIVLPSCLRGAHPLFSRWCL